MPWRRRFASAAAIAAAHGVEALVHQAQVGLVQALEADQHAAAAAARSAARNSSSCAALMLICVTQRTSSGIERARAARLRELQVGGEVVVDEEEQRFVGLERRELGDHVDRPVRARLRARRTSAPRRTRTGSGSRARSRPARSAGSACRERSGGRSAPRRGRAAVRRGSGGCSRAVAAVVDHLAARRPPPRRPPRLRRSRATSSGTSVAWKPPITTGTPRRRYSLAIW